MFLQTLAISDEVADNVCETITQSSVLNTDLRGKHSNRPLSIKDVKNAIRKHINILKVISVFLKCTGYIWNGFQMNL